MKSSPVFFGSIERILVTVWVGGLWITGYLVAPTLFSVVDDRSLAGSIAGVLFTRMSWLGLGCGALLLILGRTRIQRRTKWLIVAMLLLIAVGQFVLHPMISNLRASGLVEGTAEYHQFATLHGISSVLFMVTSILGAVLVIRDR